MLTLDKFCIWNNYNLEDFTNLDILSQSKIQFGYSRGSESETQLVLKFAVMQWIMVHYYMRKRTMNLIVSKFISIFQSS